MDKYSSHRSWTAAIILEKLCGLFPYENYMKNFSIVLIQLLVIIVSITVLGLRMIGEIGINPTIVVENAILLIIQICNMIKLVLCFINLNQRKKIYDQIAEELNIITDKQEIEVIKNFSEIGLKVTILYLLLVASASIINVSLPMLRMYYNYFLSENKTRLIKQIPFYVEYYVDQEKYYYPIMIHMGVTFGCAFVLITAHDMPYIMIVQHVCSLFKIVVIHLEKASEAIHKIEDDSTSSILANKTVYNHIIKAISLHKIAIRDVICIDKVYKTTWFLVLTLNMFGFGGGLVIILLKKDDLIEAIRYGFCFLGASVHFYIVFWPGQNIMDTSLSVFEACCNCEWYKFSKKCKTLLLIMMVRSAKHCELTGANLFVLCMETYSEMFKTGLSFFTVFAV